MKALLAISLISSISACSYQLEPNPWTDKERVSIDATHPIKYPELAADLGNLESVLEAALGNFDIAEANARALEEMSRAYNAALDAGEAEFDLGQIRARQLAEERRARVWDRLSIWSILAVIGVLSLD